MNRMVLHIAYDGTNYHGWQMQKFNTLPTIQQKLELALSKVADQPIKVIAAGRTDAKVHASQQIVHFDSSSNRTLNSWIKGTNSYLPLDIRVLNAMETSEIFDARRTAQSRTYNYLIYNASVSPCLFRHYMAWEYTPLNIELMQKASNYWLGEHDFSSFRGKDCQSKSAYRTVYAIKLYKCDNIIRISITANAFLKHMVRKMVGVLINIGLEKFNNILIAKEILLAKDPSFTSMVASPQGLYLAKVIYPKKFKINQKFEAECLNPFKFIKYIKLMELL